MPAPLTEGNLYAIYAVLADYRQARDQHDTQAIADIAAGLDAWLRSLLEVVKSHKVTWIPVEERLPGHVTVWVFVPGTFLLIWLARYDEGAWWTAQGGRDYICPKDGATHWAEIRWPPPPQKEGER